MSKHKLLLINDVENVGRSGDVVEVRAGFARNYLLPKGIAIIADKQALRRQERLQEERKKKALQDAKESEEIAKRLNEVTISITVKVDEKNAMYGSVTVNDILKLLEEQANVLLNKKAIDLKHPIKDIGVHHIKVKLLENVPASFTLKVIEEETELKVKK